MIEENALWRFAVPPCGVRLILIADRPRWAVQAQRIPMRWLKARASVGRAVRIAVALASAGLAGGCFQPLYGEGTLPGSANVRDALSSVAVQQIDAAPGSSET